MAAKLAVGYTLDEIPNDITKMTPASFEPSIDYIVTKIPRWAFEKLPGTSGVLGTQMQSVGEAMSIGRTFPESLQKGLRSLEQGRLGLGCDPAEQQLAGVSDDDLLAQSAIPTPDRLQQVGELLRRGVSADRVHEVTRIDPWFLDQMGIIVDERHALAEIGFRHGFRPPAPVFPFKNSTQLQHTLCHHTVAGRQGIVEILGFAHDAVGLIHSGIQKQLIQLAPVFIVCLLQHIRRHQKIMRIARGLSELQTSFGEIGQIVQKYRLAGLFFERMKLHSVALKKMLSQKLIQVQRFR